MARRGGEKVAKKYKIIDDTVQQYIVDSSVRDHPILAELRQETDRVVEYHEMMTPPEEVQLLQLLVSLVNAKRVIEVGVFTGHATLAMALALPEEGRIIACDIGQEWPSIGLRYWQEAKVDHKIALHIAPALQTLQLLLQQGEALQFDFAFVDADKIHYADYYELLLQLLRPGGLMVFDNILWVGDAFAQDQERPATRSVHALTLQLKQDARVNLSVLPVAQGMLLVHKKPTHDL